MATNLSIDPKLLERALEEFIARRRQKRLLDLVGQLEWDRSFDYKTERSGG